MSVFETELPTNQTVHIRLAYTGANQTAILTLTTNGVPLSQLPPLVLSDPGNSQFTPTDNFRVDTFSISSYSSAGDDLRFGSRPWHRGQPGHYRPTPAHYPADGRPDRMASGQAQFFAHSNWLYTLERSTDLHSWAPASVTNAGTEDFMMLQDTDPPAANGLLSRAGAQP